MGHTIYFTRFSVRSSISEIESLNVKRLRTYEETDGGTKLFLETAALIKKLTLTDDEATTGLGRLELGLLPTLKKQEK